MLVLKNSLFGCVSTSKFHKLLFLGHSVCLGGFGALWNCGCHPEEAPVEPGLKELGSLLCAVQCVPAFPLNSRPNVQPAPRMISMMMMGLMVMIMMVIMIMMMRMWMMIIVMVMWWWWWVGQLCSRRPRLPCSSPPLHSSSKHFRNMAPPLYTMRMVVMWGWWWWAGGGRQWWCSAPRLFCILLPNTFATCD